MRIHLKSCLTSSFGNAIKGLCEVSIHKEGENPSSMGMEGVNDFVNHISFEKKYLHFDIIYGRKKT